ncbi:hypothetical protein C4D60_Mb01t17110 [Musa balbisiana]|uniref:Uncharacterized protein n=1 Tax=Musa balbisiana TaxID=52838 RepID=A0A4S8JN63_MUSBA|nr:hypothetical protein C4D60_Mb01t17110 [Musa balbisiana]
MLERVISKLIGSHPKLKDNQVDEMNNLLEKDSRIGSISDEKNVLLHGGKTHASHLFFAQNQFAGIHSSDLSRIHFRVRQALDSVAALRLRHALLFIVCVFYGMIVVDAEEQPVEYLHHSWSPGSRMTNTSSSSFNHL